MLRPTPGDRAVGQHQPGQDLGFDDPRERLGQRRLPVRPGGGHITVEGKGIARGSAACRGWAVFQALTEMPPVSHRHPSLKRSRPSKDRRFRSRIGCGVARLSILRLRWSPDLTSQVAAMSGGNATIRFLTNLAMILDQEKISPPLSDGDTVKRT